MSPGVFREARGRERRMIKIVGCSAGRRMMEQWKKGKVRGINAKSETATTTTTMTMTTMMTMMTTISAARCAAFPRVGNHGWSTRPVSVRLSCSVIERAHFVARSAYTRVSRRVSLVQLSTPPHRMCIVRVRCRGPRTISLIHARLASSLIHRRRPRTRVHSPPIERTESHPSPSCRPKIIR